ncbi:MAG TPA: hypothetical protein VG329_01825 [Candidatus Dormibacteraeota bacterium]|nr:hypothetical protein [Candidatus Dormibacteraeota bacterium]
MSRRVARAWLAAVTVIGLGACSFVMQRVDQGASPSPSASDGIAATIPLSTTPGTPAVGAGAVWVPNLADGTLARIDPGSNRLVATIKVGDPAVLQATGCGASSVHSVPPGSYDVRRCDIPSAVNVSGNSVWVTKNDARAVAAVDTGSNQLGPAIPIGVEAWGVAAAPDSVWVSDFQDDIVVRVDPASGQVVATIHDLPHGPTGLAVGFGYTWVACSRAASVARIDPASNAVTAVIPVQERPLSIAVGFGSVWVRNTRSNSVSRIDPATNQVVATIPVMPKEGRDGVDGMGVDSSGVWVSGLSIVHISAASNAVDKKLARDGVSLDYGAGALWVTRLQGDIIRLNL